MMRLLRPPPSGIFQRSFRLHSPRYARETIAGICSLGDALATAIISQTGSWRGLRGMRLRGMRPLRPRWGAQGCVTHHEFHRKGNPSRSRLFLSADACQLTCDVIRP